MKNTRHLAGFIHTGSLAEPKLHGPAQAARSILPRDNSPRNNAPPSPDLSIEVSRQPVIFVPFEATMESLKLAKSVVSTALQAGARMVLFHAVHLNLTPYGPANPAWIKAALRREATEMAEPLMHYAENLGVSVICVVEEGAPTAAMVQAAAKWEADVIVLTAREKNWLGKWLERRALNRVIRATECPVMVLDAVAV